MSAPHPKWTTQKAGRAGHSLPLPGKRQTRDLKVFARAKPRPAKAELRFEDSRLACLLRMLDDVQREAMSAPVGSERARHLADAIADLKVVIARG